MGEPFLAPRFVGPRFEDSTIPLDMLRDLAVLEEFIVALAKDAFLRANRTRKRLPRGFNEGISLRLAAVSPGSAVAQIHLDAPAHGLFGPHAVQYYAAGREALVDSIAAAAAGQDATQFMSAELFGYFDRFGRGLRDDESIAFTQGTSGAVVSYTPAIRRTLRASAAGLSEYTEEISLDVRLPELDQEKLTFEAITSTDERIPGSFTAPHRDALMEGFMNFKEGGLVRIEGIGRFDHNWKLRAFESVDQVTAIDLLDVPVRLQQLGKLQDNWLHGAGV